MESSNANLGGAKRQRFGDNLFSTAAQGASSGPTDVSSMNIDTPMGNTNQSIETQLYNAQQQISQLQTQMAKVKAEKAAALRPTPASATPKLKVQIDVLKNEAKHLSEENEKLKADVEASKGLAQEVEKLRREAKAHKDADEPVGIVSSLLKKLSVENEDHTFLKHVLQNFKAFDDHEWLKGALPEFLKYANNEEWLKHTLLKIRQVGQENSWLQGALQHYNAKAGSTQEDWRLRQENTQLLQAKQDLAKEIKDLRAQLNKQNSSEAKEETKKEPDQPSQGSGRGTTTTAVLREQLKAKNKQIEEQEVGFKQECRKFGTTINQQRTTLAEQQSRMKTITEQRNRVIGMKKKARKNFIRFKQLASMQQVGLQSTITHQQDKMLEMNQTITHQQSVMIEMEKVANQELASLTEQQVKNADEEWVKLRSAAEQTYNQTLNEFRTHLQTKQNEVDQTNSQYTSLKDQHDSKVSELSSLRATKDKKIDELNKWISTEEEKVEELRNELKESKAARDALEKELKDAKRYIESAEKEITTRASESQNAFKETTEKKIKDLEAKLKEKTLEAQTFSDEREDLSKKVRALEASPNASDGYAAALERQNAEFKTTRAEFEERVAALRSVVNELRDESAQLMTSLHDAEDAEKQWKKTLERKEKEIQHLKSRLERLTGAAKDNYESEEEKTIPENARRRPRVLASEPIVLAELEASADGADFPPAEPLPPAMAPDSMELPTAPGSYPDDEASSAEQPASMPLPSMRKSALWMLLLLLLFLMLALMVSSRRKEELLSGGNESARLAWSSYRAGGGTGTAWPSRLWDDALVTISGGSYA